MRILWLVSIVMPEAAQVFHLRQEASGSWLTGALESLRHKASITIVCVCPAVNGIQQAMVNGVEYIVLPRGSFEEFVAVLGRVQPAMVHIWGSETAAASTLFSVCDPAHTLVSVQGVMTACAQHLNDGVPDEIVRSSLWQRFCNTFVPGHLPDLNQKEFDNAAAAEQRLLSEVRHVTGRTAWDREQMARLAPQAAYYPCGELLRAPFYLHAALWAPKDFGDAPTLFMAAGNYPLKGLHRLIEALPAIQKEYPRFTLRIAGWKPVDKGAALRWLTDSIFPWETWCRKTAIRLGVWEHIRYTGPLNEQEMLDEYLKADCFCLCSSVENSPNSLGEAMMLGLPCVAAEVGGVPSMAENEVSALLYPAQDSGALAQRILRVLGNPPLALSLGRAASQRAQRSYHPDNAEELYTIYGQVLDSAAPVDYHGGVI